MKTKVIAKIYRHIQARKNCIENKVEFWQNEHENTLAKIEQNFLPHGSGIDSGCKIDLLKSNENKIVISFDFHHMNESGFYDGYTSHNLIVKPGFDGLNLHITGKNRNYIKDYLYETFDFCLNEEIEL